MSNVSSSCAVAPPPISGGGMPAQSPVQVPLQGGGGAAGGVQSPLQAPVQGGGPQSPMQVPASSAVQGAAGGGQLVQPGAAPTGAAGTPGVATSTPEAAPAGTPGVGTSTASPVPGAQPAAPVEGGGAGPEAIAPVLQQLVATLNQLVATLQAQLPQAQAEAGAAGVQGGGGAVSGESGAGVVDGGGPVEQAPAGAGCGCGMGAAQGAAGGVQQGVSDARPDDAGPRPAGAATQVGGRIDGDGLTVKGTKMDPEQRRLAEIVLRRGKEMGANRKVLETAVSTMIQESIIKNDASVDSKDLDSLGLFQQRPSQGWGTREQISDPRHAATKFFEKAIANDRKDPSQAKTRLAQSVQISAYPDAYARWDREAEAIVADFLG